MRLGWGLANCQNLLLYALIRARSQWRCPKTFQDVSLKNRSFAQTLFDFRLRFMVHSFQFWSKKVKRWPWSAKVTSETEVKWQTSCPQNFRAEFKYWMLTPQKHAFLSLLRVFFQQADIFRGTLWWLFKAVPTIQRVGVLSFTIQLWNCFVSQKHSLTSQIW